MESSSVLGPFVSSRITYARKQHKQLYRTKFRYIERYYFRKDASVQSRPNISLCYYEYGEVLCSTTTWNSSQASGAFTNSKTFPMSRLGECRHKSYSKNK